MEWTRNKYNQYYEHYMPWIEDKYLAWRGENKASYSTKEAVKTDVTGAGPAQKLQSGLAEGVGGQMDNDGLLGGVGQKFSTEGFNRVERGEPQKHAQATGEQGKGWTETVTGGMLGGGKKEEEKK